MVRTEREVKEIKVIEQCYINKDMEMQVRGDQLLLVQELEKRLVRGLVVLVQEQEKR